MTQNCPSCDPGTSGWHKDLFIYYTDSAMWGQSEGEWEFHTNVWVALLPSPGGKEEIGFTPVSMVMSWWGRLTRCLDTWKSQLRGLPGHLVSVLLKACHVQDFLLTGCQVNWCTNQTTGRHVSLLRWSMTQCHATKEMHLALQTSFCLCYFEI